MCSSYTIFSLTSFARLLLVIAALLALRQTLSEPELEAFTVPSWF
jgi:hypothetical protein